MGNSERRKTILTTWRGSLTRFFLGSVLDASDGEHICLTEIIEWRALISINSTSWLMSVADSKVIFENLKSIKRRIAFMITTCVYISIYLVSDLCGFCDSFLEIYDRNVSVFRFELFWLSSLDWILSEKMAKTLKPNRSSMVLPENRYNINLDWSFSIQARADVAEYVIRSKTTYRRNQSIQNR